MGQIQYISDEQNNITGVIVPIELWREIESEKETASLLKSKKMNEAAFLSNWPCLSC